MDDRQQGYDEQAALWNGVAGQGWVRAQRVLDRLFEPMEAALVQAVVQRGPGQVLDVGCGTGATTLAVAREMGERGRCIGIDVSGPMIDAARRRAENEGSLAQFVCDDAQRYRFAAGSFDTVISRLGVMFFDDPVTAFRNLRTAMREGGVVRAIVWRSAAENPFMTVAEQAAAPLIPSLPARQPGAPGQFAFADAGRVSDILERSGWADIAVRRVDFACGFPAAELAGYVTNVGPVGRVFGDLDRDTRERVVRTVLPAFDRFLDAGEVRFTAACWLVEATAPSGEGLHHR
ncbi:class I SAM-dependent methyltransferase [Cupriavidus sp. AU9028]|uniref:class I SAM-dependent methyltransferase n=1 Tax=Cupriavidus sp. AU9028 TaxID=2871157 RepID=UPI001C949414|nr:class I SAM-dependent methyltransferase [Cupriavidus sp. AU9028]MBY4898852.1 class I SAM-dependent methyltransferase [Cupriavidus sp. AU9028]